MKDREQVFHVMSRVVDRRLIMGEREREVFYRIMRSEERFSGCEVLTYALMGNHFHLLIRVPVAPAGMSEEEVFRRMRFLYGKENAEARIATMMEWRAQGMEWRVAEALERLRRRMFDMQSFVKDIKQRFTRWYNDEHERKGTLWEERFKSVLVEGRPGAMRACASYIDLNPLKAGLCSEPGGYRWTGFAEARAGGKRARACLMHVFGAGARRRSWTEIEKEYEKGLRERAEELRRAMDTGGGDARGRGWSGDASGGVRIRHFTDGVALGDRDFIDEFLLRMRQVDSPRAGGVKRRRRCGGLGLPFMDGLLQCAVRIRGH
jgi:REP element-mobilizing transposase RayT